MKPKSDLELVLPELASPVLSLWVYIRHHFKKFSVLMNNKAVHASKDVYEDFIMHYLILHRFVFTETSQVLITQSCRLKKKTEFFKSKLFFKGSIISGCSQIKNG